MSEKNQEPKKAKIRIFFWETVLFSLTLFLGIFTAIKINDLYKLNKLYVEPVSPWVFIFYFIFGTGILIAISSFIKKRPIKGKIFKMLFVFAIFFGGLVALEIWLSFLGFLGSLIALALMFFLIVLWFKRGTVFIHDLCIALGLIGIGANLGLRIDPAMMALFLGLFSIYDFIAVYKTKHMVKIAKDMIEYKAIVAFIVPQRIKDFRDHLDEVEPGGRFLILGGGDVAFPLLLSVSLVPHSLIISFVVAIFSVIGVFFSYFIFIIQKRQKPIPALPPIALFSVIGFLLSLIFIA